MRGFAANARVGLAGLAVVAASLATACGGPQSPGFRLHSLAGPEAQQRTASFAGSAEMGELSVDDERRPVLWTGSDGWRWQGRVPENARLDLGLGVEEALWKDLQALEVAVTLTIGDEMEVLEVGRIERASSGHWLDLEIPMHRWAGREVVIHASAYLEGPLTSARVAWSPAGLHSMNPVSTTQGSPNVLLIVVDTLRADRLTPYGYDRETSPEIARWLADPGVVVESAYAQAPWTLPSMASMMTGRQPGAILGADWSRYGIAPNVPSLGERMASEGYRTAAFMGNATLHDGNGFGRGFETFYSPSGDWFAMHADDLNRRAEPWLRAHQDEKFFLVVHYMDPHDPYENPDLVEGKSSFFPDYDGKISGRHVHGIYRRVIALEDEEQDVRHLGALYDSEVAFVDRYIGRLLETLDEEVLARTLIVLTSDHGEELFEHGGWKHGYTLYEEQIHVPLILRWDSMLPAGTRLEGTVSLVDLVPTLMAATGGASDERWSGRDLLPALRQKQPLERRPAFAQHLIAGPLRAASVVDDQKVILFNHRERFEPADALQEVQWNLDLERLAPRERYRLDEDALERDNLIDTPSESFERLERVIHYQLNRSLDGLRILVSGLAEGQRLDAKIRFEQTPSDWRPYFLADSDRVVLEGRELSMEIHGDIGIKGVLLAGDPVSVEVVDVSLEPMGKVVVQMGSSRSSPGEGKVPSARLIASAGPPTVDDVSLGIWLPPDSGETEMTDESTMATEDRLRALGYLD